MSRSANPTAIGAFVVGAVVIAVAAVLLLTSGPLFQQKARFVLYFDGSVKGLNVGSPVTYRGVQVGTVTNIDIVLSPERNAKIPVTVEIDPAAFTVVGKGNAVGIDELRKGIHESSVKEGLRAQLQIQSLLTGQLFIQLDYFPGTPVRFVETGDTPEIPTIPTTLDQLTDLVKDFPIKKVLNDVARAVAALAALAEDDKVRAAFGSADQAFQDVSGLARHLDERTQGLGPVLAETQKAVTEGRQTLAEGRRALVQARQTLATAEQTFTTATETLAPMKNLVSDDSELLESLDETLAALTKAAQAVGALADTLERRPEAVLKGKGPWGTN